MTRKKQTRFGRGGSAAGALLGALALALSGVSVAAPASASEHLQDISVACEGLTAPVGFTDITGLHPETQAAINCLAQYGITQGRNEAGTIYAPRDIVKRYEMALFLERVIGYLDEFDTIGMDLTYDPSDAGFQDLGGVPQNAVDAINALANLGIANGKTSTAYDPYSSVSRRDMATFVFRVQDLIAEHAPEAAYDPADATVRFDDVPEDLERSEHVYALEGAGIVQGTSANTYKPYASVLRSEMAFFIMRHLNENIAAGRVDVLAE